jgi:hypothetical protein
MFRKKKEEEAKKDPLVKKLDELLGLRHFARGVNVATLLASAGGNVLHATKTFTGITLSLAAPILLMLAFELLSRIPIRKGSWGTWVWLAVRIAATAGIATITAWISYFHQRDGIYNETGDLSLARLLPAAIDFLMIVSAGSLIELNIQIRDMEAIIAGTAKRATAPSTPVAPKKGKPEDQKAATIAQIWARSPQLSVKQIASLADTSYNYTHKIVSKLKESVETPEPVAV